MIKPNNGKVRLLVACVATLLAVSIAIIQSQGREKGKAAVVAEKIPVSPAAAFGGDCEDFVIRQMDSARSEILVAIFTFSRRNIAHALHDASARGVKVDVKYDANSYDTMEGMAAIIDYLKKNGVTCTGIRMRKERALMHHKFVVIDSRRVVTGSFNFTTTATKENYENLASVDDEDIARAYKREFDGIKDR